MRFLVKNLTSDTFNPNAPYLWPGQKLYCCSDNLSNLSIIGPGETQSISSKGYEELMKLAPQKIQVMDSTGASDPWAPFRAEVPLAAATWLLWDAGRMSGKWDITNQTTAKIQFSFSGFTAAEGVVPGAQYVSDVLPGETVQFWSPMNPLRYVYLYSTLATPVDKPVLVLVS